MGADYQILIGDVREQLATLDENSVHCVVTSPPYWGLRDYGVSGQLGLESTLDEYVAVMGEVFQEVNRVLRTDGTLWLNLGDTYANDSKWGGGKNYDGFRGGHRDSRNRKRSGLKSKDLCGVPWRVALELQRRGWWLRSEVIWHKRSPMPLSVKDRPTTAHEHVFLLAKSARYFYDQVAGSERCSEGTHDRGAGSRRKLAEESQGYVRSKPSFNDSTVDRVTRRNARSVWTLSTEPFREAHFATYPTELVRRCLLHGVSERGVCPACGAPWMRLTEQVREATRPGTNTKVANMAPGWDVNGAGAKVYRDAQRHVTRVETIGWEPGCACNAGEPIGALVLDPFLGSGTTIVTALRLGARGLGIELSPEYAELAERRIKREAAAGPLFAGG